MFISEKIKIKDNIPTDHENKNVQKIRKYTKNLSNKEDSSDCLLIAHNLYSLYVKNPINIQQSVMIANIIFNAIIILILVLFC